VFVEIGIILHFEFFELFAEETHKENTIAYPAAPGARPFARSEIKKNGETGCSPARRQSPGA
jgi:hypothetical protein